MEEGRLRPEALADRCRVVGGVVECLDRTASTNTYLKEQALLGAPHGLAVTAEEQTGGRGRWGRQFQSPRGKGLYLSVLLRPRADPEQLAQLTAWAAVAVCRAVEKLTGLTPALKWPNDVLLGGKKLCGILTELVPGGDGPAVVLGIGLNVSQGEEDFTPEVAPIATSLAQHMTCPPDRAAVAKALLEELDRMMGDFPRAGAAYRAEYRDRCVTLGREVEVCAPGVCRRGRALALGEDFSLTVAFEDGAVEPVRGGEVSLRGVD